MNLNCTWRDMMREAAQRLGAAGVENPARDARLLLAHALQMAPADVIAHELDAVDPVQLTEFEQLVQRRLAGEPVSRIRGWREFYGRRFRISPDVLDPRPETELLVSEGLRRLPKPREGIVRVLDLGTGSGCILVSVLAERPDAAGVGLDISPAALAIARDNARALGVSDRASFIEASWEHLPLEGGGPILAQPESGRGSLRPAGAGPDDPHPDFADAKSDLPFSRGGVLWGAFDLVLSNPPYIAEADLATLPRDVRAYDPLIALIGVRAPEGPHGEQPAKPASPHPEEPPQGGVSKGEPRGPGADALTAYRAILALAPQLMKPGGWIGVEFGLGQADDVAALMADAGLTDITVHPDLAGIVRAAFGRKA